MKKTLRQICFATLAALVLGGCAKRDIEIHTPDSATRGSGISDASEASGPGASAAAGAALGHPGR
jgi:hypothetical protein